LGIDAAHHRHRLTSDVVADDRHHAPADFFECCSLLAIAAKCLRRTVPVESVVFDGNHAIRPGEVDSPDLPVPVDDLVLKNGVFQAAVKHDEPRFAFHRGLCFTPSQWNEISNHHDPTPACLGLHGRRQPRGIARAAA